MIDFFRSGKSKNWEKKLKSLKNAVNGLEPGRRWMEESVLIKTLDTVVQNLSDDLKGLENEADFMFSTAANSDGLASSTADLLRQWYVSGRAPSLAALSINALENYAINPGEDMVLALLMAAVLGEVENDLSYHNNMHYRKVLLQTIRMIAVHNDIYAGTKHAFDDSEVALLLMSACVHDLGHDGQGNTVKGVFQQSRMERKSFDYARPYLEACGIVEESILKKIYVMLLCTDVTPLGDLGNPSNQMKAAYRFHFMGDKHKLDTLNLDPDLDILQKNEKLCLMGLLLHEADIATSAGVSYTVTKYETSIYRREVCDDDATPEHVVQFLDKICQRKMLSDAGQKLFGANLARIYALAEDDVSKGNEAFPKPDFAEFIVGAAQATSPKTIN